MSAKWTRWTDSALPRSAAMAERRRGGCARGQLDPVSCCCHLLRDPFSLFWTRSRDSGRFPSRRVWCRTKKFMNQHKFSSGGNPGHQLNHSPSPKVSAKLLLLSSFSQQPTFSKFPRLFCHALLINSTHYYFLWPLWSSRKSLSFCLRWIMEEEVAGAGESRTVTPSVPWRGAVGDLVPSD
ncbi:hypothetical protein GWK47_049545 [Chionoecetes opilio]|uniref:Uncharacterized protein n=1 Tax=Chionoecetes opilio TaxID=41210 RepID=A0A8J4Y261_CHIOP|nr:hypothetical protein GWK47_049545 [Chionoecetes opilio]